MATALSLEHARHEVAVRARACPPVYEAPERCDRLYAAEPIHAPIGLPRDATSRRDGYALHSADTVRAGADTPVSLAVIGTVTAGDSSPPPPAPAPGQAVRIMTGALLPLGTDTVLAFEELEYNAGAGAVTVCAPAPPGRWVRTPGSEITCGELLLNDGLAVGPAQIAVATALGIEAMPVHRRPRIAVVAIGSELAAAGAPLPPGHLYNDAATLLCAHLHRLGAETRCGEPVEDTVTAIQTRLREALQDGVDLVITTGGTGDGDKDLSATVLSQMTGPAVFRGVAIRPGGGTALFDCDGIPCFALPGAPSAAAMAFDLLVRPAVRILLGAAQTHNPLVAATLVDTGYEDRPTCRERAGGAGPPGLIRVERARVSAAGAVVSARVVRHRNVYRELSESNALWVRGAEAREAEAGTSIELELVAPITLEEYYRAVSTSG